MPRKSAGKKDISKNFQPIKDSTRISQQLLNTGMSLERRLPSTIDMVKEAIYQLNGRNGFSLFKLKQYICENYVTHLTSRRYKTIKTILRNMFDETKLENVTGKGLVGRIRLVPKNKRKTVPRPETSKKPAFLQKIKEKKQPPSKKSKQPQKIIERKRRQMANTPENQIRNARMIIGKTPVAPKRISNVTTEEILEDTPRNSTRLRHMRRKRKRLMTGSSSDTYSSDDFDNDEVIPSTLEF